MWKRLWIGQAHNEYLQVLLETGLAGAALFGGVFLIVLRRAAAQARTSFVDLGVFGAVVGLALHNLVDFNWQIPANAAAWVALAALAARPPEPPPVRRGPLRRRPPGQGAEDGTPGTAEPLEGGGADS